MQTFWQVYNVVEKTFFFTLSRKIIGNISFLFIFQIINFYLFYSMLSAPPEEQHAMQGTVISVFVISTLCFGFTIFYLHHLIVRPVKALLSTLNHINHTQGDLSTRLPAFTCDEFSELSAAYNTFAGNLARLIAKIYQDAEKAAEANNTVSHIVDSVNSQASQQKQNSQSISQSAQDVSHRIDHIVSAAEQVSTSNEVNLNNAVTANDTLETSQEQISSITELLNQFASTVTGLQNNAENVRSILKMVEGFADQTNLLALNAAIEAARAGEAGRGFAVVADEVRSLSAKVADATQQISKFLNEMDTLVKETQNESGRLIDVSTAMNESVNFTRDTFATMMHDFNENIAAFSQILEAVNALSAQQQTAAGIATNIAAVSDDIQHQLEQTVNEASRAKDLANSTQQGLTQFVVKA